MVQGDRLAHPWEVPEALADLDLSSLMGQHITLADGVYLLGVDGAIEQVEPGSGKRGPKHQWDQPEGADEPEDDCPELKKLLARSGLEHWPGDQH